MRWSVRFARFLARILGLGIARAVKRFARREKGDKNVGGLECRQRESRGHADAAVIAAAMMLSARR